MQNSWKQGSYSFLTPKQAWDELMAYKDKYYRRYAAVYSGERMELSATSENKQGYWARAGKCRLHVPIAADIASTSADLLFSEEPRFTCIDEETEDDATPQQQRLDKLISLNNITGKLNEAAESCAALGDIFFKLNWSENELDHPVLTVIQADSALPEYFMGILKCIHFFSVFRRDSKRSEVIRVYERYEPGKITMALFVGSEDDIGTESNAATLEELGYAPEIRPPIEDMLAVHIPNIRPNRKDRDSNLGRSDFDGLRGLMDALDETYSSWMRDIRLAKARLIVPAEYLRRNPSDLFKEGQYTYEFDEDIETLVALDIDPEHAGSSTITSSQFDIRSVEHAATCQDIIRNIVTIAGYAPQSFGLNIEGYAQSGTALHIRERKSFNTKNKKQTYWTSPLEKIMSAMIHLDAAIYPNMGSEMDDEVKVHFADSIANDINSTANAIDMLNRAAAISTEIKIQMLHPDWTKKQVKDEVERVKQEQGLNMDAPMGQLGDYEQTGGESSANENGGEEDA